MRASRNPASTPFITSYHKPNKGKKGHKND
nr:MAG TPA: hypothetical protein [Caudoviricetes sp.]